MPCPSNAMNARHVSQRSGNFDYKIKDSRGLLLRNRAVLIQAVSFISHNHNGWSKIHSATFPLMSSMDSNCHLWFVGHS